MTSKVLVKMPGPSPFAQVNNVKKSPSEQQVSSNNSGNSLVSPSGLEAVLRVGQLEHNIRFLQEQHALLLSGLHREIEILRQKNTDLQFQLVFSKRKSSKDESASTSASPTETPDNPKEKISTSVSSTEQKLLGKSVSISNEQSDRERCIQLEKELTAARAALQTSLARATELQVQLQHYKNKETIPSESSRRIAESWSSGGAIVDGDPSADVPEGASGGANPREAELRARLGEAERLVEGLRAHGERQRREVHDDAPRPSSSSSTPHVVTHRGVTNLLFDTAAAPVARNYLQSIKASLNAAGRGRNDGGKNGQGGCGGGSRGSQQRFPPLQPPQHQAYWQQRESAEYGGWNRVNHRRGGDKGDSNAPAPLPDLRTSNVTLYNNGNGNSNHRRGGGGGGNHGYSNQYFRNSERGHHRNSDRSHVEEDHHQKSLNNPSADLSDGEVEVSPANPAEGMSRGNHHHRHKRGNHRHHDKS